MATVPTLLDANNAVATATANKLMSQSAARMNFYFPDDAVAKAAKEPSSRGMGLPLLRACAFSSN